MNEKIDEILNSLFPTPPIPLKHYDPYTLLIAVLLSAQCTDERVNIITPALFKRAGTPELMAAVPLEEIETFIKSCGLYRTKSKAISSLSKILVEKFNGEVPRDLPSLESLPGVGHKTASVVVAQAFKTPAFPVDTHIHRCAKRWGLSSGISVKKTEEDLKKAFPKDRWNTLHLQIIYYARKYCPARGHEIDKCPICSFMELKKGPGSAP